MGAGCGCLIAVLAIALVVMAVMSLAAIVDPFAWMPTVEKLWAECEDDPERPGSQCELGARFPGSGDISS